MFHSSCIGRDEGQRIGNQMELRFACIRIRAAHLRPDGFEWGKKGAQSGIVTFAAETIKTQPTRLGESRSIVRDDKTRKLQWESSHQGGETIDSIEQVEEVPKRTILLRSAEDSTSHAIGSALFPIRDATMD